MTEGLIAPLGTVLDRRYRLDAIIGEGAMGVVYRATHVVIDKPVAVKILRHLAPRFLQRFLKEARLVSRVSHPNVVELSDYGETPDGGAYFVMALLTGEPLADTIARERRIDPTRTLRLALQIAEGLKAAHAAGVVHRDLKPENVFLCRGERLEDETVKLLDFGVARVDGSKDTTPGSVFGTPEYMAPEQARGQLADGRADLYALGVMLFEMLVGRVPLYADSIVELMQRKLNEVAPRISTVAPGLPIAPELDEMIAGLLSIEPRDRLPDAAAVLRVLQRVTPGRASSQRGRGHAGKATIEMGSGSTDALAQVGTVPTASRPRQPGSAVVRVAAIRSHQHGAGWQAGHATPRLASMAQSGVAVIPTAASVRAPSNHVDEPAQRQVRVLPVLAAMGAAAISAALVTLGVSQVIPPDVGANGAALDAATPPPHVRSEVLRQTSPRPVPERSARGSSPVQLNQPAAESGTAKDSETAGGLNQDAVVVRSPGSAAPAARATTRARRRKPISKQQGSPSPRTGSRTTTTPTEAPHGSDAGQDEGPDAPSHASERPIQPAEGPAPPVADPGEVTYDLKDPFPGN